MTGSGAGPVPPSPCGPEAGLGFASSCWPLHLLVPFPGGLDLPLLLIFSGVIGGLMAFRLIGIFVGPVALAVVCTRLQAWVGPSDQVAAPAEGS